MIFAGDCRALEAELYSGKIRTDEDLRRRASDLGARVGISDSRDKVWRRGTS